MEALTFKTNVNARDAKGWNATAIAVFHHSKRVLRLLLEHGGDVTAKNQYGKSAEDLAQDELDAAGAVYKSNAEIREVLDDFRGSKPSAVAVVRGMKVSLWS